MSEFFIRLQQRKLVQWAIAYVAFAFALLQGIDIVAQRFVQAQADGDAFIALKQHPRFGAADGDDGGTAEQQQGSTLHLPFPLRPAPRRAGPGAPRRHHLRAAQHPG